MFMRDRSTSGVFFLPSLQQSGILGNNNVTLTERVCNRYPVIHLPCKHFVDRMLLRAKAQTTQHSVCARRSFCALTLFYTVFYYDFILFF